MVAARNVSVTMPRSAVLPATVAAPGWRDSCRASAPRNTCIPGLPERREYGLSCPQERRVRPPFPVLAQSGGYRETLETAAKSHNQRCSYRARPRDGISDLVRHHTAAPPTALAY